MIDVTARTKVIKFIIIIIIVITFIFNIFIFFVSITIFMILRKLRSLMWQCKAVIYFSWVCMRCSSCFKQIINVFKFSRFSSLWAFLLSIIKYVSKFKFNILKSLSTKSLFSMIFKSFHFNLMTIIFEIKTLIDFSYDLYRVNMTFQIFLIDLSFVSINWTTCSLHIFLILFFKAMFLRL